MNFSWAIQAELWCRRTLSGEHSETRVQGVGLYAVAELGG